MSITPLDNFFEQQKPEIKECMLALKNMILSIDKAITPMWKYGMPFFYYRQRMFCYLWVHKKYKLPYLGIVDGVHIDHIMLLREKRSRMKIMLLDPSKDLPVKEIESILRLAIDFRNKARS